MYLCLHIDGGVVCRAKCVDNDNHINFNNKKVFFHVLSDYLIICYCYASNDSRNKNNGLVQQGIVMPFSEVILWNLEDVKFL